MYAAHGGHGQLQRDLLRCQLPNGAEGLRGNLYPAKYGVYWCLPKRLPRLQRPLQLEHGRDLVRHVVHAVPGAGELGRKLRERQLRLHL